MIIGVPKEIKNNEYRVSMIPSSVQRLVEDGHQLLVETEAGMGDWFLRIAITVMLAPPF
jgi:alanine dehydrogenase